MNPQPHSEQWDVPVSVSGTLRQLIVVLALLLFTFLVWAIFADLHEGAIASGEVVPFGKTKTVQHPEGGIVREILVKDGDTVSAEQPLLVLDDKEARALQAQAKTEWLARKALVARLLAERDGKNYRAETQNTAEMAAQLRIFEIRRQSLRNEITSLQKRAAGLKEEYQAWSKRRAALGEMTASAQEERTLNQSLYEKNFISRPRLLSLDNQLSDRQAAKGETEAELARVSQRLSDTELQITKLKNDWLNAVLEDLTKAQDELSVAEERLKVAEGRLQRTQLRAPHDGIVKGLRFTTIGAVIPQGGVVLDIVPVSEKMVIEAKVLPDDIDVVHEGTHARVRFTAYKARAHIAYDGKVLEISPSTYQDDKTGQHYYLARIEVPEIKSGEPDSKLLQAGMLAEISFTGSTRSPLRYLLDPLLQSMTKAFREE